MELKASTRNSHRLMAYVFTATVLVNVVSAVAGGPDWIAYLAVAPLVVMMFTGWYLLWLPHGRQRRAAHRETR